jgi:hypothetical protein
MTAQKSESPAATGLNATQNNSTPILPPAQKIGKAGSDTTSAPIDTVLALLTNVRQRQPGQWSARCPAHADKGPSLSLRETPDGAVLIHCFAECEVADIVAALGLEMHQLFPPRDRPPGAPKRTPRLLTAGQALTVLADKATLVAVAAANVGHGVALSVADKDHVLQAAGYINWVRHEVMGLRYE